MALVADIEKTLGNFSLKVHIEAEDVITALLGASGSGKSMTLKCIAGIEKPDRGHIELDGKVLFDSEKKICLPPQQRHVGYLFQQYALFPNMTVRKNILCGIRKTSDFRRDTDFRKHAETRRGMAGRSMPEGESQPEKRVAEIIRIMHLEGLENKYPSQISGGEQQRTALARILVNDPEVLLLDEPFSALDTHLRFRLERELREILRQFGRPVLLVSHDRDEVYRLADRITIIKDGAIEAAGTKYEVFADPQTADAARMTGCKNISRIRQAEGNGFYAEEWGISLQADRPADGRTYAGIRMHDLRIIQAAEQGKDKSQENCFACRVVEEIENPFSFTIMIRPMQAGEDSMPIGIELDKKTWKQLRRDELSVYFPPEKILLLR